MQEEMMKLQYNIWEGFEPSHGVLLHAFQPIEGSEEMLKHRSAKKTIELCNGPLKFCSAMGIEKETCEAVDLCTSEDFWIGSSMDKTVISCSRIGIDKVGQPWVGKDFLFYVLRNEKNAKHEEELNV